MERYRAYIVPETPGSIEETIANVSLVKQVSLERARISFQRQIPGFTLSPQEKTVLTEESDRLFSLLQARHVPDFRERMSPEEKDQIFLPPIEAMHQLAVQFHLILPKDLLQRVKILDKNSFMYIASGQKDDSAPSATALTLSTNRLCLINNDRMIKKSSKAKDAKTKRLAQFREVGIHELWHSSEYVELWVSGSVRSERRKGIATMRPRGISAGYIRFHEGFIQYLTQETLKLLDNNQVFSGYQEEVDIVDALIAQVGIEPFMQATFTKKGFKVLFDALETRYGKGAFRTILDSINQDWNEVYPLRILGRKIPIAYPRTKKFLEATK